MKKIILLGVTENARELSASLSAQYRVEMCESDPDVMFGMLGIIKPDLIIINTIGSQKSDEIVFGRLSVECPEIPVLAIGPPEAEGRYAGVRKYIKTPTDPKTVLSEVYGLISPDEIKVKKTVMVVDDNPVLLRSVKPILEPKYSVMLAVSGAQALTSLKRKCPDLILLDCEMPAMDGEETLRRLRENEQTKNVPVLFLTGLSDPHHLDKLKRLDAQGYIIKPYSPQALLFRVEKLLK